MGGRALKTVAARKEVLKAAGKASETVKGEHFFVLTEQSGGCKDNKTLLRQSTELSEIYFLERARDITRKDDNRDR